MLTQLMRFGVIACLTGAGIFGVEWAIGMDEKAPAEMVFVDLSDLTDAPDENDDEGIRVEAIQFFNHPLPPAEMETMQKILIEEYEADYVRYGMRAEAVHSFDDDFQEARGE